MTGVAGTKYVCCVTFVLTNIGVAGVGGDVSGVSTGTTDEGA